MPDYSSVKTENLKDMILRHEKQGQTNIPSYLAAIEELARRHSKQLNPDVTFSHLKECARQRKFTSYKAVAEASGATWEKVHWQMPDHLDYILQICNARGLPLLTAICVNAENTESGELAKSSLAGFIKGAKRLKYDIVDERQFFKDRQQECFAWGETL